MSQKLHNSTVLPFFILVDNVTVSNAAIARNSFPFKFVFRHYKLAYQHCTECETVDSELFELRAVAGLLNYKVNFVFL